MCILFQTWGKKKNAVRVCYLWVLIINLTKNLIKLGISKIITKILLRSFINLIIPIRIIIGYLLPFYLNLCVFAFCCFFSLRKRKSLSIYNIVNFIFNLLLKRTFATYNFYLIYCWIWLSSPFLKSKKMNLDVYNIYIYYIL